MTSGMASRPSWTVKLYSWWTVPRKSAAFLAAIKSGAPGRPMANECNRGHEASSVSSAGCQRGPATDGTFTYELPGPRREQLFAPP